jgi:hypothetical protein
MLVDSFRYPGACWCDPAHNQVKIVISIQKQATWKAKDGLVPTKFYNDPCQTSSALCTSFSDWEPCWRQCMYCLAPLHLPSIKISKSRHRAHNQTWKHSQAKPCRCCRREMGASRQDILRSLPAAHSIPSDALFCALWWFPLTPCSVPLLRCQQINTTSCSW